MPMYEFSCRKCGHTFEELTAIDRRDQVRCPRCGGEVARVYEGKSVFGIGAMKGKAPEAAPCPGGCPGCPHHQ